MVDDSRFYVLAVSSFNREFHQHTAFKWLCLVEKIKSTNMSVSSANILTQAITFLPHVMEHLVIGKSASSWDEVNSGFGVFLPLNTWSGTVFSKCISRLWFWVTCVRKYWSSIMQSYTNLLNCFLLGRHLRTLSFFGIGIFKRNESLLLWRGLSRDSLVEHSFEYSLYLSKKTNTLLPIRTSFSSFFYLISHLL